MKSQKGWTASSINWHLSRAFHSLHMNSILKDYTGNGWRTTITDQKSVQEEIKGRLKSGNACYHSVQNLLSYSWLSNNLKIKIYRTVILPAVVYGCETWSLTLREEHRLMVLENRVLRRIFGSKRDEVTESGENYIMRSLIICTHLPVLFG